VQSLRTNTSACSGQTNMSSQLIQKAKLHLDPKAFQPNPVQFHRVCSAGSVDPAPTCKKLQTSKSFHQRELNNFSP